MKRARRVVCTTFALLVILFAPARWGAAETHGHATLRSDQGSVSPSSVPQAEYDALVAFYHATDGDNWGNNLGWLTDPEVRNWRGVWIRDGHVTKLMLGDNHLRGTIPPELANLANLDRLYLSLNELSGEIPPELSNLANLQDLHLWANELSGTIPPELGNLTHLRQLGLSENELSGTIPPELSNLTNLRSLYLDRSGLSGTIPPELGNLANLQYLNLSGNELSGGIPPELGDMPHLGYLDLSDNQLSGAIPPELSGMPALKSLNLACNQLSGAIPPELGDMPRLQSLNLAYNRLSGAIPPELGDLVWLHELYLQGNCLSGEIPSSITNLTILNWLPEGFTDPLLTDLGYNELWSEDPQVDAFLDEKDPDWHMTQTVPPANVHVVLTGATGVQLAWAPIAYSGDTGYYEVGIRATEADPYTILGRTESKLETAFWDGTLAPDTTYHLAVRSYTERHDSQQNDLLSEWSETVQAVTKHPYAWFACVQEDIP